MKFKEYQYNADLSWFVEFVNATYACLSNALKLNFRMPLKVKKIYIVSNSWKHILIFILTEKGKQSFIPLQYSRFETLIAKYFAPNSKQNKFPFSLTLKNS